MKKQLSLSINNPCAEKWEGFTPTQEGGFCQSCQKNVVDYTRMSDEQVLIMLKNTSGKICGRLRVDQMKEYIVKPSSSGRFSFKWMQTALVSILLLLTEKYGIAGDIKPMQEVEFIHYKDQIQVKATTDGHIVQGTVMDKASKEALPGVNVLLKGSNIGTVTDIDGFFKFPKKLQEGDVLVFSFIGLETKEYKIPKKAPEVIEIPMDVLAMRCVIMGELSTDEVYTAKPSGIMRLWQKIKSIF